MTLKFALVIILGSVPFILLSIWAIVDALQKDFGTPQKKAVWAIVAAIPYIGCIVYFLFGYRRGKKPARG